MGGDVAGHVGDGQLDDLVDVQARHVRRQVDGVAVAVAQRQAPRGQFVALDQQVAVDPGAGDDGVEPGAVLADDAPQQVGDRADQRGGRASPGSGLVARTAP